MTKHAAAEKVAKLMRLAKGSSNTHEAANARSQAEKLVKEHGLTESDLASGERAAAFDDLVDAVHAFVRNHPSIPDSMFGTSAIVTDVLNRIKNIQETEKSARLGQITTVVRAASFIAGDDPNIKGIKHILDETLRKHEIVI
jgi:carboxylesterase type B